MSQEILVRADHLTKEYKAKQGTVQALTDVSLTIYRGETLALVGESGCGKSTLGRVLLQSVRQDSGDVFFHGQNLSHLKKEELRQLRQKMQMIFQDPYASLDPRMNVETIIQEPLKAFGLSKSERNARVQELIRQTGIPEEYLKRYPHQFSGGQRQRIGIARALALKPEFVVCDEPVSALDVSIQAQILNLLEQLQKELNLTYLFVSHDLSVVNHIADRVCVMFLGQICEIGPTEEIFFHPQHPYTKLLLDATPVIGNRLEVAEEENVDAIEIPSSMNPPSGCRFHTRCPYAAAVCKEVHPDLTGHTDHLCACHMEKGGNCR